VRSPRGFSAGAAVESAVASANRIAISPRFIRTNFDFETVQAGNEEARLFFQRAAI
jgi:hypothetical protein